jgi:hypothetical protein
MAVRTVRKAFAIKKDLRYIPGITEAYVDKSAEATAAAATPATKM